MSKLTERLLQVGAALAIIYFGWSFAQQIIISRVNLSLELNQCQSQLNKLKGGG